MKKTVLAILSVIFLATVGYCQDAHTPLQLTIKSDKSVYEVGDEVILTITWKNSGNRVVQIDFREDSLLYNMLTIVGKNGEAYLKKVIMYEFAPEYKRKILPGDKYVYTMKGRLTMEPVGDFMAPMKPIDSLVITFEGKILSDMGLILGEPGTFELAFHYQMPADAYWVKSEPETWSGNITSNRITLEVKEKKTQLLNIKEPFKETT